MRGESQFGQVAFKRRSSDWGGAGTEKCRKTDREGKREHEYEYEHPMQSGSY